MYKKVELKNGFVGMEHEVAEGWKKKDIIKKNFAMNEGKRYFTFYDGPPTANGKPHVGHIETRVMKDIIPRYKVMKGYHVDRKAGWDTHGLPVELEIEKKLGISGKEQIEDYGVEKFVKECKESVFTYVHMWEEMTNKVGYWVDMKKPYVTYHNEYIESIWWGISQMWKKGLLYEGYKVMPYCPRCGTALSSHEVAQGYKDVKDLTCVAKFKVEPEQKILDEDIKENTYILAWTTTPWTLPSNLALCVNKSYEYAMIKANVGTDEEPTYENYILAKDLIETVLKETPYEKRIQRLMTGEDGDQYGFYINITDNIVREVKNPEKACWEDETGRPGGVTHWLQKQIYPYILDDEEEKKFRRTFLKEELLRIFQTGQRHIQLGYRFRKGKYITCYTVNIEMFEHPVDHTVECCAIWRNDTIPYINRVMTHMLLRDKYRMIAVLDIQENTVFVRKHTFENTEIPCDSPLEYEGFIRELSEKCIQEKSREWFRTSASLNTMEENLQVAGIYSFTVYNADRGAERYTYQWLDKEYREVLIAVEDRTVEMEKDPLTDYLNRDGFVRKTENILKKNADRYQFAIIYFNIRKFYGLNDVYGYENGDRIIRSYMDRIQNSTLRPLALGRVAADRFQALVDAKNLEPAALGKLLQYQVKIGEEQVEIYGRCGIYYIPKQCKLDVSQMCDLAKMAKNKISNQYVQPYAIYQEDMRTEYEQKNLALLNLEKALEQEEFVVCYQPVVEGKTGQIVSAEALVRWNSSGEEPMIPSVFVPELEDSGYITKLDTYIDQTVRRFQEERYHKGKRMIPVAVNLSRMDLMNSRLMERICTELQETKVPKQYFRYEIIESAYTIISKEGEEFLKRLRKEGVQIFLDDFGTGISTFETVRDYTFDALKMDMGFVKKIGKDPKRDAIVISIIDMAHRMGMKVVAEGIENKQQSEFLCTHGCDYLQGYYYYKPMSEKEFSKLLDK